jgi:streptogrisin D
LKEEREGKTEQGADEARKEGQANVDGGGGAGGSGDGGGGGSSASGDGRGGSGGNVGACESALSTKTIGGSSSSND